MARAEVFQLVILIPAGSVIADAASCLRSGKNGQLIGR